MKTNPFLPIIAAAILISTSPARANDSISINIANPAPGTGYSFADNILTITQHGSYTLTGNTSGNRIEIAQGISATITLQNLTITGDQYSPLKLSPDGCNVTVRLEGNNALSTNNRYTAGLTVEGAATLAIEGNGSLTVTGGYGGAGIGSGGYTTSGTILINSGAITATGGYMSAGIGGGMMGNGRTTTITGGVVTANGGEGGAGIGSGGTAATGNGSVISITGGVVTANGGEQAAGIGGGYQNNGGNIHISGGFVTANGNLGAAAIGGGCFNGDGGSITISGGVVMANGYGGQNDPAAIGGGYQGNAGTVNISGGSVYAYGGSGAGIGGAYGTTGGSISISGGSIFADKIGIGNNALTPTTITGGAIIVNTINTTSFGQAVVLTGVSITEAFVRTAAVNAYKGVTVEVNIPKTIEVITPIRLPDTIIYVTDTIRDTIPFERHDTVEVHLLHIDTLWSITYDTLLQHDTIVALWMEHDTLFAYDTLYDNIEVILEGDRYVVIATPTATEAPADHDPSSPTNATAPNLRITTLPNDEGILLTGLTPDAPFAIYSANGLLLLRATPSTNTYLPHLPPGTYILSHNGQWRKFTHK